MSELVNIPLTEAEVLNALKKALLHQFIDNLRDRHPNVQLDSKVRGYVGELAFRKWMRQAGISFSSTNKMKLNRALDIDFTFDAPKKKIEIELKTSLLPDSDLYLHEFIRRRDIKLICRRNETIEELHADLHVQLVFKQLRLRKDEWLKKQKLELSAKPEDLYQSLAAYRYCKDTYFVGWIDKKELVRQINNKVQYQRKWKYGKREFWTCNLAREAKKPMELINYLKSQT